MSRSATEIEGVYPRTQIIVASNPITPEPVPYERHPFSRQNASGSFKRLENLELTFSKTGKVREVSAEKH